jgi:hypothetical protein
MPGTRQPRRGDIKRQYEELAQQWLELAERAERQNELGSETQSNDPPNRIRS